MIAFDPLSGTTGGVLDVTAAILPSPLIIAAFALYIPGGMWRLGLTVALRHFLTAERAEPVGQPQDA